MVRLRQGLAKPERESDLTISQVAHNLACTPFSRCITSAQTFGSKLSDYGFDFCDGLSRNQLRVLTGELDAIGILFGWHMTHPRVACPSLFSDEKRKLGHARLIRRKLCLPGTALLMWFAAHVACSR